MVCDFFPYNAGRAAEVAFSEHFFLGGGGDEVFEVERFEVGGVGKFAFAEELFGERGEVGGGGFDAGDEAGVGGGEEGACLVAAVAEEIDGAVGEFFGKGVGGDDFGAGGGEGVVVAVEEGGVDLHAAGVEHGAVEGVFAGAVGDGAGEGAEGGDGDEGDAGAEAEAFGCGDADAESGVGAGTHADGDGVEIADFEAVLAEEGVDVGGEEDGVVESLVVFPECLYGAVFHEGDGAGGGGGVDGQDVCHGAYDFNGLMFNVG